jgi:hypothetical protein
MYVAECHGWAVIVERLTCWLHAAESSWEPNSGSACQEIPVYLWNVFFTLFTSLQTVAILSQINPLHTLKYYFPKIHLNIYLPYTLR